MATEAVAIFIGKTQVVADVQLAILTVETQLMEAALAIITGRMQVMADACAIIIGKTQVVANMLRVKNE